MLRFTLKMSLAALLCCATSALAQYDIVLQTVQSMPLRQFQDSLGVNIHLEYTDGGYANSDTVLADLKYIGINHVRDSVPNPTNYYPLGYYAGVLPKFFAAGIHFNFMADGVQSVSTDVAQWNVFAKEYPGLIDSIEGPNEINNSGLPKATAMSFQQSLYTAVHDDTLLNKGSLKTPVLYFTGDTSEDVEALNKSSHGYADATNIHPYAKGGVQPLSTMQYNQSTYFQDSATFPKYITETGYYTIQDGQDGVDETSQAELLMNSVFDGAMLGYQRSYVYELLDAYQGQSWGFFNFNDGSPKFVAQAFHNLASMIPLDAASAQKKVEMYVVGLPSTAHQLALTGSDGSVYLWVWNEIPIYNESTRTGTVPPSQVFAVQLPGANYSVSQFTPAYQQFFTSSPVGTYNGYPYYASSLYSFPVCTIFKPVK